jgi:hypothetical protein
VEVALEIAGQLPWPSQLAAAALALLTQPAALHATEAPTNPAHDARSTPSHSAARQGASVVPALQAARDPRGLPETARHFPSEPETSHASHCPSHGALQQ